MASNVESDALKVVPLLLASINHGSSSVVFGAQQQLVYGSGRAVASLGGVGAHGRKTVPGYCVSELHGHVTAVGALAASKDRELVAACQSCREGPHQVAVFNASTLETLVTLTAADVSTPWSSCCFLHDGEMVAAVAWDATKGASKLKYWDAKTGELLFSADIPYEAVKLTAEPSAGGAGSSSNVLVQGQQKLQLWHKGTALLQQDLAGVPHGEDFLDHCWAHAGHRFFVLTASKQLLVLDRSGLLCKGRLEVVCGCVAALADNTVVVGSDKGTVFAYSLQAKNKGISLEGSTQAPEAPYSAALPAITSLTVDASGCKLGVQIKGGPVYALDSAMMRTGWFDKEGHHTDSWQEVVPAFHSGPIVAASVSVQGHTIVTASQDLTVRVWRYSPFRCVAVHACHTTPLAAAIDPWGQQLVVSYQDSVCCYSVVEGMLMEQGQLLQLDGSAAVGTAASQRAIEKCRVLRYSPSGHMVALAATAINAPPGAGGRSGREIILIDTLQRRQVAVLRGHPATVSDMAWSADGLFLCTASEGAVFTWSMDGYVKVQEDTVKSAGNAAVAAIPDFGLLLTGGPNSCLRGLSTLRCKEAAGHPAGDTGNRRRGALPSCPSTPSGAQSPSAFNPGSRERMSPRGLHRAAGGSGAAAAMRLSVNGSTANGSSRAARLSITDTISRQPSLSPLADQLDLASSDGFGGAGGMGAVDVVDLRHAWAAPPGYMTPVNGCLAVAQTSISSSSGSRTGNGAVVSSQASPAVVCGMAGGSIRVARLGPSTESASSSTGSTSTNGISSTSTNGISSTSTNSISTGSTSGISSASTSGTSSASTSGSSRGAAYYGPPGPWQEAMVHVLDPTCLALHANGHLLFTADAAGGWAMCALVSASEAMQVAMQLQQQRTRGRGTHGGTHGGMLSHGGMGRSHGGAAVSHGGAALESAVAAGGGVRASAGAGAGAGDAAGFCVYVKAAVKLLLGVRAPSNEGAKRNSRRPTTDDAAADEALEVVSLRAVELQLLKSSLRDSQKAVADSKDELRFRVQEAATKARQAVEGELKQLREHGERQKMLAAAEADKLRLKAADLSTELHHTAASCNETMDQHETAMEQRLVTEIELSSRLTRELEAMMEMSAHQEATLTQQLAEQEQQYSMQVSRLEAELEEAKQALERGVLATQHHAEQRTMQMQDEAEAEAHETASRHSKEQAALEDAIMRLKKSTRQANQDRDKAVAEKQRAEGQCAAMIKEKQTLQATISALQHELGLQRETWVQRDASDASASEVRQSLATKLTSSETYRKMAQDRASMLEERMDPLKEALDERTRQVAELEATAARHSRKEHHLQDALDRLSQQLAGAREAVAKEEAKSQQKQAYFDNFAAQLFRTMKEEDAAAWPVLFGRLHQDYLKGKDKMQWRSYLNGTAFAPTPSQNATSTSHSDTSATAAGTAGMGASVTEAEAREIVGDMHMKLMVRERMLASAKQGMEQTAKIHSQWSQQKLQDNSALIHELNAVRKQLKEAMQKLDRLEAANARQGLMASMRASGTGAAATAAAATAASARGTRPQTAASAVSAQGSRQGHASSIPPAFGRGPLQQEQQQEGEEEQQHWGEEQESYARHKSQQQDEQPHHQPEQQVAAEAAINGQQQQQLAEPAAASPGTSNRHPARHQAAAAAAAAAGASSWFRPVTAPTTSSHPSSSSQHQHHGGVAAWAAEAGLYANMGALSTPPRSAAGMSSRGYTPMSPNSPSARGMGGHEPNGWGSHRAIAVDISCAGVAEDSPREWPGDSDAAVTATSAEPAQHRVPQSPLSAARQRQGDACSSNAARPPAEQQNDSTSLDILTGLRPKQQPRVSVPRPMPDHVAQVNDYGASELLGVSVTTVESPSSPGTAAHTRRRKGAVDHTPAVGPSDMGQASSSKGGSSTTASAMLIQHGITPASDTGPSSPHSSSSQRQERGPAVAAGDDGSRSMLLSAAARAAALQRPASSVGGGRRMVTVGAGFRSLKLAGSSSPSAAGARQPNPLHGVAATAGGSTADGLPVGYTRVASALRRSL